MEEFKGIAASPGIVSGITCLYSDDKATGVPHYVVPEEDVQKELDRLDQVFERTKETLTELSKLSEASDEPGTVKELIRAHTMIIDDIVLREKARAMITEKHLNAEHAVEDAFDAYAAALSGKSFHFADIAHDIEDVKKRVLDIFTGSEGQFSCPVGEQQPVIVVAKKLTPSMVLSIPREHVLAFVTDEGGLTTHASILARSYNVPILYGVDITRVACGQRAIVDATREVLFLEPEENVKREYHRKIQKLEERQKVCEVKRAESTKTRAGERVELKINITSPGDIELVRGINYDGIGLLRTEFLFKDKLDPPAFEEQRATYAHIIEQAEGKSVTVRLLDIAGDKMPPYMELPPQENPDLGIRGARAADVFRDIYITQIKAILSASRDGLVGLLYPMVSDISDVRFFDNLVEEAKKELKKEKIPFDGKLRKGVMIETPAAAVNANMLLEEVDFANLGTNDLLQYTLAASRGSRFIENRYHIMHPALIRLMSGVARAGQELGKEVCLCGEIAGFEGFYPVFLSIGLKSFSVPPARHEELKCHILFSEPMEEASMDRFWRLKDKKDVDEFFRAIDTAK